MGFPGHVVGRQMGVSEEVTEMLKRAWYKGHIWSWDGKVIRQEKTGMAYDPKTREAWIELSEMNEPVDDLEFKRLAREVHNHFEIPDFIRIQVIG